MTSHLITIPGTPVAQPRHRHTRGGHTYDPKAKDKKALATVIGSQLRHKYEGPVRVLIECYHGHEPETRVWVEEVNARTKKPDADNCAKYILDMLTQAGLWDDDSQVSALEVHKFDCPKPSRRRHNEITVEDMTNANP